MTYRCNDCVYSEILNKNNCDMRCLKHGDIVQCMNNHCDDLILRPFQFLSHISYVHNYEKYVKKGKFDWAGADQMAREHLEKYGFAGMTAPERLVVGENVSGRRPTEIRIPNVTLKITIETLIQLMNDAHYGLPKELYDIRLLELRNFIDAQLKYNEHFGLTTQEEVEKTLAKYGEELK